MTSRKGWKIPIRARVSIMYAAIAVLLCGALGRIYAISVVEHEHYSAIQEKSSRMSSTILAERGRVFDRSETVLAQTVFSGTSLYLNAKRVHEEERLSYAGNLARILDVPAQDMYAKLYKYRDNAGLPLAWYLDEEQIIALQELMESGRAPGLEFRERVERVYPLGQLAAQVLGFVNRDGNGAAGIERIFDKQLKGRDGHHEVRVDALRRAIPDSEDTYTPPTDGADLYLTLDSTVQGFAEEALSQLMEEWDPEWCTAVIMESNTGKILAIANAPTFDPARFFEAEQETLKNRAITDPFEPGSVFKPLILCGGIENGLFTDETAIPYKPSVSVFGRVVTDGSHPVRSADQDPSGYVRAWMGIVKSSNTAANYVAQSIFAGQLLPGNNFDKDSVLPYEEAGRLDAMLRNFGFGSYTGFDLGGTHGGESRGTLPPQSEWTQAPRPAVYAMRNVVPSLAQGYQVQVTGLQMLSCFNAIATGGTRMRPYVVEKVVSRDGQLLFEQLPEIAGHSGISPETAAQMRKVLEKVVSPDGTARRAYLPDYRLAGKTGTASITSATGGYAKDANTCTFVGFAPAHQPVISAIVVARNPRKRKLNEYGNPLKPYGGSVAAPYMADIVDRTLRYLGVPPQTEAD